jgi:predicted enzyme related to lactoylglutathione lyase
MHFNHLGLPVRDYQRSLRFYAAYFGFDPERDDEEALAAFKCLDPDGHRVEVYWEPLVAGGA